MFFTFLVTKWFTKKLFFTLKRFSTLIFNIIKTITLIYLLIIHKNYKIVRIL